MSDSLQVALAYAQRGWHVFPLPAGRKDPFKKSHGFYDATTDVETIRRWWTNVPQANIGVAVAASGLVLVDVDHKNGTAPGLESWHDLLQKHGQAMGDTVTQETPTGGLHVLYKANGQSIANSDGALGPGLEVKAASGYFVASPSTFEDKAYSWAYGHSPEEHELLPFPDCLRVMLQSPRTRGERGGRVIPDTLTAGDRHPMLKTTAARMRYAGLSTAAIAAALQAVNAQQCKPPKSEAEVQSIAEWAGSLQPEQIAPTAEEPPPLDEEHLAELEPGRDERPALGVNYCQVEQASTWLDMAKLLGPITWAWQLWLANGFMTILAAETGKGKSMLALRLAGCFILGWPWPDGSAFTGERGKVLWCEAEGAQALNLERAGKWGLPLDSLLNPLGDPLASIDLDSFQHKQAIVTAAKREDVRFIVVDSLSAASKRRDENSSAMLQVVTWLANLGRDVCKPVLTNHHLRKKGMLDGGEPTLDRLRGYSGIVQPARLVWALHSPDVERPEALRLSVLKSNLGRFPKPAGMIINDEGHVEFGEAPKAPQKESRLEGAMTWLRASLSQGTQKQDDIAVSAEKSGVAWATLKRAKEALGVESRKTEVGWLWSLAK